MTVPAQPPSSPPASAQPPDDGDDSNARVSRHHNPRPRLPHEHDQSSDSQANTEENAGDERIDQAAQDLKEGQVDTGRYSSSPSLNRGPAPTPTSAETATGKKDT